MTRSEQLFGRQSDSTFAFTYCFPGLLRFCIARVTLLCCINDSFAVIFCAVTLLAPFALASERHWCEHGHEHRDQDQSIFDLSIGVGLCMFKRIGVIISGGVSSSPLRASASAWACEHGGMSMGVSVGVDMIISICMHEHWHRRKSFLTPIECYQLRFHRAFQDGQ